MSTLLDELLAGDVDLDDLDEGDLAELVAQLEGTVADVWTLTPRQLYAEAIGETVNWMLFGGAAGAGKSELSCYHANKLSLAVPGHMSLMLRRSIPELRRSLIIRLIARIGRFRIPARYRKLDGQAGFAYQNGSLIECGHMQTEESIAKYLGSEYDLIVADESTTLTVEQIVQVASRLRTTREKAKLGARPHLWLLTNPGGLSHAWHYDVFITPTDYGQKIVTYNISQGMERRYVVAEHEAPINVADASDADVVSILLPWVRSLTLDPDPDLLHVAFVPARATHNQHIDPGYMRSLNTLSERRRRQLRDGDWDTFEGMYFHEFRRETHVVQPFPIPESWTRARGIDYGTTNPYCCLWGAWDEDDNCYIYREDYEAMLTPQEQARRIVERSVMVVDDVERKEKFQATVADPSVFSNHRGVGKTVADLWRDSGLHVTRAKNDRIGGWMNVRQYLWDTDRAARIGDQHAPRLFIFDTCRNLVRTLPLMQSDPNKPEDINTKLEDHACLAAETLVATDRGVVRIDEITTDHRVLVSDGTFSRVLWAGVTGERWLWRLGPLVGSGDHPVWTQERGWLPMHSVVHCDTLNACPTLVTPSSCPTPSSGTGGPCTTAAGSTFSARACACIDWSGRMRTDPSPTGGTFTTSTATATTTDSPTCSSCTAPSTSASTLASQRQRAWPHGLAPYLTSSPATPSSPPSNGPMRLVAAGSLPVTACSEPSCARCAELRWSHHFRPAPSSAAGLARLATFERAAVPLGVKEPVWNLVIEGDRHEFYANGVLVHNCDALRYLLATRPISNTYKKERRPATADDRFQAMLRKLDRRRPRRN